MILGFPYLQVSIVPFKVVPFGVLYNRSSTSFTAGCVCGSPISWCFPTPPEFQVESQWYPWIIVPLDIYLREQELRDDVSVRLCLLLLVLAHSLFCVVLFMVFIQQIGLRFLS